MNNVLTLKREIIGDSSYVPHLELYDAKGAAVNIDVKTIDPDTMEKIQEVAHRIFQGFNSSAEGQTVQTLTERGLTVEGAGEAVSLETAGVDDDWDELMKLLIGAGAAAAVKDPVKRLLEKTEQLLELQQFYKKLEAKQNLSSGEIQILQKFNRKCASDKPIKWKIETFIQQWLFYYQPIWKIIENKKGVNLDEIETNFFKACKALAVLRHGIPTNPTDDIELVRNMYKHLSVKNDNTNKNN